MKSTRLASVEVLPELTVEEQQDRQRLELRVERAFIEAALALKEIRDRRLYRSSHKTFEAYCRDRFAFTRNYVNKVITAGGVIENLGTIVPKNLGPTNEAQCRPLAKLEPEEQIKVWQEAVDECGGKVPTAKLVSQVAQKYRPLQERTKVEVLGEYKINASTPHQFKKGDWVIIKCPKSAGVDFIQWNGYWAGVLEIKTGVTVLVAGQEMTFNSADLEAVEGVTETFTQVATLIQQTWQRELEDVEKAALKLLSQKLVFTPADVRMVNFLSGQLESEFQRFQTTTIETIRELEKKVYQRERKIEALEEELAKASESELTAEEQQWQQKAKKYQTKLQRLCPHTSVAVGLDICSCNDCGREFVKGSKQYERLVAVS